nr:immunoglobulin heavy chain junction region [Mus musculus]MBK4189697.1 immunoglobulin heavy chain junction region [Mus musculus]MBK4189698.1 immunoglobulin heavy chain junction region [Mus musculus]
CARGGGRGYYFDFW